MGMEEATVSHENVSCKRGIHYCDIALDDSITSRRCFMTGGYCSKQRAIQEERKKLHEKNEINAFMVMNFSDISNMQYNRKIKKFIEGITDYMLLSDERIYCFNGKKERDAFLNNQEDILHIQKDKFHKVEKIHAIRADTTYASNFIMCSRICQQMLTADLVVVDVSVENANVFYELGMAVALGKLILPICSRESYFKREPPSQETRKKFQEDFRISAEELARHIGYFPWRKQLFEYYGIRFRNTEYSKQFTDDLIDSQKSYTDDTLREKITRYIDFQYVQAPILSQTDRYLSRFPYSDKFDIDIKDIDPPKNKPLSGIIGKVIYDRLKRSYNYAGYDDNTAVIYIEDGFLNEKQVGRCIVNYYINITKQMRQSGCFCGDRVGVLVQENQIPDSGKDSKRNESILYGTNSVFQIAVNEATYKAQQERITVQDQITGSSMDLYLRDYIHNKAMPIYPDKPVYVKRIKENIQPELWEQLADHTCLTGDLDRFYCLYHVMLENLKYTNQVVVDISDNSLQSLFWLGAAHGANIYAISVKWEKTETERETIFKETQKDKNSDLCYLRKLDRNIFDVAGLWTAVLRTNDIDGFYQQIAIAQMDIDHHSKLMLSPGEYSWNNTNHIQLRDIPKCTQEFEYALEERKWEEKDKLESYYRDHFWKAMLQYNSLQLYMRELSGPVFSKKDEMIRAYMVKWDVEAMTILSSYLSKWTIIGEYQTESLMEKNGSDLSRKKNFLCIGDDVQPFASVNEPDGSLVNHIVSKIGDLSLAAYLEHQPDSQKSDNSDLIHHFNSLFKKSTEPTKIPTIKTETSPNKNATTKDEMPWLEYRGYESVCGNPEEKSFFKQFPSPYCYGKKCSTTEGEQNLKFLTLEEMRNLKTAGSSSNGCAAVCRLNKQTQQNTLLAQLILWREVPENVEDKILYRVALNGVSGPATKALTSLFVDEEQAQQIFSPSANVQRHVLACARASRPNRAVLDSLAHELAKEKMDTRANDIRDYLEEKSGCDDWRELKKKLDPKQEQNLAIHMLSELQEEIRKKLFSLYYANHSKKRNKECS